jgi:CHAT domain-containing protein
VHAAGIYGGPHQECTADYVVSSYTPTLAALLRAQENVKALNVSRSRLTVIAVERAQDKGLSPLWNVKNEAACIISCARKATVTINEECAGASATRMEIPSQFQSAHLVHITSHGIQDPEAPLKSRFFLSDGSVSVEELMKLDLKDAFLAFLSACETAKGDQVQPDQTIHLAATMLFVGFKSVVGTLW